MSETLQITRAAGVKMFRQPKLALPAIAAAVAGYLSGSVSQTVGQSLVQKWLRDGGASARGSALVSVHGLAALSRGQMLALEFVVKCGFDLVGSLCMALALVATVRMVRRDGEAAGRVPWGAALALGALWWLLDAAVRMMVVMASVQLDGIASVDAVRAITVVAGVVLSSAVLWVIAPRAVRLAAMQGGMLHEASEKTGQRIGVLTAVLSALLLAINTVATQSLYARLDPGKLRMMDFAVTMIGALPLVMMFIGFAMLTAREANEAGV